MKNNGLFNHNKTLVREIIKVFKRLAEIVARGSTISRSISVFISLGSTIIGLYAKKLKYLKEQKKKFKISRCVRDQRRLKKT